MYRSHNPSSPKEAFQNFLDDTRDIFAGHLNTAVRQGKLSLEESNTYLNRFNERSEMLLGAFNINRPKKGGALSIPQIPNVPQVPTMNALKGKATNAALSKISGVAGIPKLSANDAEQLIQAIQDFKLKDAIPTSIEPYVDKSLWVFIPEVRDTVKTVVGSVFILGGIEKLPIIGPMIATAVDVTAAYLPSLAVTIQNMLPNIVALAPVPYANFIGEAAGFAVSAIVLFLNIMINISRAQFSEAFQSLVGLVPVFGTTLMTYVDKFNKSVALIQERKEKIMKSVEQVQALVQYAIPMATQRVAVIFNNYLPFLNDVLEKGSNRILMTVEPLVNQAKSRLQTLKREQATKQTGGRKRRYKKTMRRK